MEIAPVSSANNVAPMEMAPPSTPELTQPSASSTQSFNSALSPETRSTSNNQIGVISENPETGALNAFTIPEGHPIPSGFREATPEEKSKYLPGLASREENTPSTPHVSFTGQVFQSDAPPDTRTSFGGNTESGEPIYIRTSDQGITPRDISYSDAEDLSNPQPPPINLRQNFGIAGNTDGGAGSTGGAGGGAEDIGSAGSTGNAGSTGGTGNQGSFVEKGGTGQIFQSDAPPDTRTEFVGKFVTGENGESTVVHKTTTDQNITPRDVPYADATEMAQTEEYLTDKDKGIIK